MCNQSRNITDADVFEEFERQGQSVKEYAKNETTIPCNKEWLRTIRRLLNKEHLSSFSEVTNALEITDALLEYADGNFEYETEDDILYPTIENMRRVIRSSYAKRIKRSMTNQRNARGSQKGTKDVSQEYDPEPEDDDTTDGNRKQSQAIADYNRNIEKGTIEKGTIERKKYKPTTTNNNSSSGKISLSIFKAIEILEPWKIDSLDSAFKIIKDDSRKEELTREERVAAVLYLLTGRTRSNISRITNLMDEAVSKGAKELDVSREVYYLALRASGQDNSFEDQQQCRISTGCIINRLREIIKQSEAAQEQFPVEETQPSLATPQQQETEQPQQVTEQPQQKTERPKEPQLWLYVHPTIELIKRSDCNTYKKAFAVIRGHEDEDVEKTIAALYFLTGKCQKDVYDIVRLMYIAVCRGAGKEEDICKEVFDMATDTKASDGCTFTDENSCRAATDEIKNYLNKLIAKQPQIRFALDQNEKLPF